MTDKNEKNQSVPAEELEQIRQFTRKQVNEDEIYVFPLILCDNEIDRDGEKFTVDALKKLAELFPGKTGIFDHKMNSKDQTARIYSTALSIDESKTTADGEPYACLRAKAYMLRSPKNKDLIDEIEAGIKKETSVSCCVRSVRCSVCGKDIRAEGCAHVKGAVYDGKKCCHLLCEPEDAYEWSFVAVPAQKNAGVTKSCARAEKSSERLAAEIREELKREIIGSSGSPLDAVGAELEEQICDCLPLKALSDLRNAVKSKSAVKIAPMQLSTREYDRERDYGSYKI